MKEICQERIRRLSKEKIKILGWNKNGIKNLKIGKIKKDSINNQKTNLIFFK